ncbi:MAG: diaminopimelate epimerase [Bacillota bacterium]|jgi:diaminopimelate epimerase
MKADFFKYHALGNDYLVIDPNQMKINLTEANIKLICNRNFGVGSDGILLGPLWEAGKIKLRIFNPDGGEAEKSGNGIRIFSKYLHDQGYITDPVFELETLGGKVQVRLLDANANLIQVGMGKLIFRSDLIPVAGEIREVVNETLELQGRVYPITCVSIGNPHCVILLPTVSKEQALQLGPLVEHHPIFPNRINLQLLQVIDRSNIRIEIWERGAGYTLASGSSSSAAAGVAYKLGLVDQKVNVHMPGGVITIELGTDFDVAMTGPVAAVATGNFASDMEAQINKPALG